MPETVVVDQLLRRSHHLIAEGQLEDAHILLETIQAETPAQANELAYLRAWYLTLGGHWDDAAQILLASSALEEKVSDIHVFGQTERRRRAHYLLMMGTIACNLGRFDEAVAHYTQCIAFLDERRMNDVNVRIQARYSLGTAYTHTGFYVVALTHYEEALRLCNEQSEHVELPNIYYGLCDTYRHLGDFPQAFKYGKLALQLYMDRNNEEFEGRIRNLLGRICYLMGDFRTASDYYTEALAIAALIKRPGFTMINLAALADVKLGEAALAKEQGQQEEKQNLLREARRYIRRGLECIPEVSSNFFRSMLYIVCGEVAQAEAESAEGAPARELVDEAVKWYRQAIDALLLTQVKVELSKAYSLLARLLETSGQQDQAIVYWKQAYEISSRPEGA